MQEETLLHVQRLEDDFRRTDPLRRLHVSPSTFRDVMRCHGCTEEQIDTLQQQFRASPCSSSSSDDSSLCYDALIKYLRTVSERSSQSCTGPTPSSSPVEGLQDARSNGSLWSPPPRTERSLFHSFTASSDFRQVNRSASQGLRVRFTLPHTSPSVTPTSPPLHLSSSLSPRQGTDDAHHFEVGSTTSGRSSGSPFHQTESQIHMNSVKASVPSPSPSAPPPSFVSNALKAAKRAASIRSSRRTSQRPTSDVSLQSCADEATASLSVDASGASPRSPLGSLLNRAQLEADSPPLRHSWGSFRSQQGVEEASWIGQNPSTRGISRAGVLHVGCNTSGMLSSLVTPPYVSLRDVFRVIDSPQAGYVTVPQLHRTFVQRQVPVSLLEMEAVAESLGLGPSPTRGEKTPRRLTLPDFCILVSRLRPSCIERIRRGALWEPRDTTCDDTPPKGAPSPVADVLVSPVTPTPRHPAAQTALEMPRTQLPTLAVQLAGWAQPLSSSGHRELVHEVSPLSTLSVEEVEHSPTPVRPANTHSAHQTARNSASPGASLVTPPLPVLSVHPPARDELLRRLEEEFDAKYGDLLRQEENNGFPSSRDSQLPHKTSWFGSSLPPEERGRSAFSAQIPTRQHPSTRFLQSTAASRGHSQAERRPYKPLRREATSSLPSSGFPMTSSSIRKFASLSLRLTPAENFDAEGFYSSRTTLRCRSRKDTAPTPRADESTYQRVAAGPRDRRITQSSVTRRSPPVAATHRAATGQPSVGRASRGTSPPPPLQLAIVRSSSRSPSQDTIASTTAEAKSSQDSSCRPAAAAWPTAAVDSKPSLSLSSPAKIPQGFAQKLAGKCSDLIHACTRLDTLHEGHLSQEQLADLLRSLCPALTAVEIEEALQWSAQRNGVAGRCHYVQLVGDLVVHEAYRWHANSQRSSGSPASPTRDIDETASAADPAVSTHVKPDAPLASADPRVDVEVQQAKEGRQMLQCLLRVELHGIVDGDTDAILAAFFAKDDSHTGYIAIPELREVLQGMSRAHTHTRAVTPGWLVEHCVCFTRLPFELEQMKLASGSVAPPPESDNERRARERVYRIPKELWGVLCDYRYLFEELDL